MARSSIQWIAEVIRRHMNYIVDLDLVPCFPLSGITSYIILESPAASGKVRWQDSLHLGGHLKTSQIGHFRIGFRDWPKECCFALPLRSFARRVLKRSQACSFEEFPGGQLHFAALSMGLATTN